VFAFHRLRLPVDAAPDTGIDCVRIQGLDFLDCSKAVAKRAKLNPDDFLLQKFRATFATWSLWAGVDLRTVQQWLGYLDMESTMRYLKPSRSRHVRDKINEIFC
jgi:site-specific recombinase XerD